MFQVFFASLAGVLSYREKKDTASFIHKELILYMGASILAGSLIGGVTSRYLPNETITFNKLIAVVSAFVVGIVSGIVGTGGAFILIPIMLTVLKIPTRTTIVLISRELDKAIAAFIIANGAAAYGHEVTIFFTFWGLNTMRKDEVVKVKKGFLEKAFGWMMPRGPKKLGLSNMNMLGI